MSTHLIPSLSKVSNEVLVARLVRLAARERRATVTLLAHLAELDDRRLYLKAGCSSLFTWCTEVLHYSESAAYARIKCARAARAFPLIFRRLADGSVNLTTVRLLAPVLTAENHLALLDQAQHRSKREIERMVAGLRPMPDVVSMIRRIPTDSGTSSSSAGEAVSHADSESLPLFQTKSAPAGPTAGTPANEVLAGGEPASPADALLQAHPQPHIPAPPPIPLSPGRYRFQFTADEATHHDFEIARELLRHQYPDGDPAAIVKLALRKLVVELTRRKFGAPRNAPRKRSGGIGKSAPSANRRSRSRYIPAAVRREVARRDGERCTYRSPGGRRCTARGHLEFHHHEPYAVGGPATVENLSLRCRAHHAPDYRPAARQRLIARTQKPPDIVRDRARGALVNGFRNPYVGELSRVGYGSDSLRTWHPSRPPPASPPATQTPAAGAG